jgi:multiple sugar transport system substrate-binding protein
MKRALLFCLLLAVPLGLFAQSALASVDPSGQTVTYWYQHAQDRDIAMKKMIDEFNTTNQWKITVNGSYEGNYNQIYNKMVAAITAGSPPDLVVAYQNQSATYSVSDALVDLNPYVKDAKWGISAELGDFFAGFINQDVNAQFGGKRLGFPPNRSIEVMYYNLTMLKALGISAPPKTWVEFASACAKATDTAKGTYGYALDNLDASHIFAFVVSRGGTIARSDGKGYTLNTPQMKESMVFMRDLYKKGYAQKVAKQYADQNEFGNGVALFTIGSTSGLTFYDTAVKAGKSGAFDWNIAPVPQSSASRAPAIDLYGASVSVPKTTAQKQLAAWLFIKWFSEPTQQAAWTKVSKYFPVRKSAEPLIKDLLDSDPKFATAWNLLKTVDLKAEPPYAGYDLARDAMTAAYSKILEGADPDRTLADLETQANKIFKDSAP